ncbi:MAG: DUF3078 domain-containing protein [Bacteroidota bacterium]|nr:DUF3078 domain-containing protein [Bacteroidota bacterium]
MRSVFILLAILSSSFTVAGCSAFPQPDSLQKKTPIIPSCITYSSNLSASYTHYKNWKYNGFNNYSFLIRENINFDSIGSKLETHIRFNGELGYMKFTDSTWFKNSDLIDLSADIIKRTDKNLENIFTFYFNSQFLSSYESYYNDSGIYSRRWSGGFGNPMNIDIGYGTTWSFWKNCRINLTYVTFRTSVIPELQPDLYQESQDFLYKKSRIRSEYGLSLQTYIRKNLNKHVRWENYSRCFANAINRDKVEIDFRNRVIIKVLKYLDLILDSRIRYTPYPPFKFQFRNELMLSFTLEKF